MKKRAQYTKTTLRDRVLAYYTKHPDATMDAACKALKLDKSQIYGASTVLRKEGKMPKTQRGVKTSVSFSQAEVETINKIGVDKAEAIIRLLKSIQGQH